MPFFSLFFSSRALVFLLYFNRLIASLLSWALRTWTWHRYGIYIDAQAIQFSLLGGRIFFVGLRYHGDNETILVQNGHITWAYWLRRVRHINLGKHKGGKNTEADDIDGDTAHVSKEKSRLPCRLNVTLAGLEWFVYNRSAAYDSVMAGLAEWTDAGGNDGPRNRVPGGDGGGSAGHAGGEDDAHQHRLRKRRGNSTEKAKERRSSADGEKEGAAADDDEAANGRKSASERGMHSFSAYDDMDDQNEGPGAERRRSRTDDTERERLPAFLQLFPMQFTCEKAALVMGNENTSAILTVKAQALSGEVDAQETKTPDPYRQIFRIRFQKPVIEMRDNDDYREDQASRAVREKQIAEDTEPLPPRSYFRHQRRVVFSHLRNLLPYFRRSVESFSSGDVKSPPVTTASAHIPGSAHWQGLSRYLDGSGGDEKLRWTATEYAMLNPLLESPEAILTIYWDSVGRVGAEAVLDAEDGEKAQNGFGGGGAAAHQPPSINGSEPPPAWGMALSVRGGSINYGPWADRKRAELQRVFFPGLSKDAKPAQPLPIGATRVPTQFKLYVEFDDETTLRVPVREASKNWRYTGKDAGTNFGSGREKRRNRSRFKKSEPAPAAPGQRPYGWLDIKIAANATVSYSMNMVATDTGFATDLYLDLPRVEISSSVNQEVLWRSGALRIACDLSTPLKWNALRQWRFQITNNDLELFLLRDHVFLLTDLIDDWGTGPPAEYLTFTPFKYFVDLIFPNAKVYLNVNDANIINNPTSFDDNTFIIIASPLLKASVCIPLDNFRPSNNAIPFTVWTDAASIHLHMPPWNTQSMFVLSKDVGHLRDLVVDGKYHYHATTATSNTDTLVVDVTGKQPTFKAYGFAVRYFMKLKDNYFGDDVHFKTLEEYQDNLRLKEVDPEAELAGRPPHKKSNDLDVIVNVRADDPRLLLPTNIYSASRHVQIDAATLSADLRFTNYYMDLDFVLSPFGLSPGMEGGVGHGKDDWESPIGAASSTQLFVDGLHVYGSRLFGLPPTDPTYVCNWDLSVGAVTGECTAGFLSALMNGGKAFGFTFDDDENALVPYHAIVMYDVTFLRVNVKSLSIWLHVDEAAFLLSLGNGVDVNYNDWARMHYSKRANISIPDLQVSCMNAESAMRHKSRPQVPVETDAFLKTGLSVAIIGRKFNFTNERRLQQELLRREDQRTQRAGFLLLPGFSVDGFVPDHVDPPAQPVPPLPLPITASDIEKDAVSLSSQGASSSRSKGRLRRQKSQSSFLTASTASQSSVVRPQSSLHSGSAQSRQSSRLQSRRLGLQPMTPIDPPVAGQTSRPSPLHGREVSSSTRHSTLYNASTEYGDLASGYHEPGQNKPVISSRYLPPNFPLENVRPNVTEALLPSAEKGEPDVASSLGGGSSYSSMDDPVPMELGLEDVDPEILSEDRIYASTLIEMHNGISAFLNPTSAKHIAALVSALQPRQPEDILDAVQISAMDGILGAMKHQKMKGRVEDLVLRLPRANLRFLNASSLDLDGPSREEQDQYDVSVSSVTLMSRAKTTWVEAFKPEEDKTHNSFQLRLGSFELSASERLANMERPQAALLAAIENVLVSMGTKDLTYFDADIGAIEGQLSSEKIEYVASLIHRTSVLTSELAEAFSVPLSFNSRVRPHLAQKLVAAGNGVTDPGFLVRPSAVLRSARQHLRTFGSWKLAMRFRQVWFLMKPDAREQLVLECLGSGPASLAAGPSSSPTFPLRPMEENVRDVVTGLEHWRGWDLGDLKRSLFLQEFFTVLRTELYKAAAAKQPALPFMAVVRIEKSQLVLDPGPKQNEITFLDLTVRSEQSIPEPAVFQPKEPMPGGAVAAKPVSVLSIYCLDVAVRLNWEICELVDDVLCLYKKRMQEKVPVPSASASEPELVSSGAKHRAEQKAATSIAASDERTFHIVFAMSRGSIMLDTINLNIRHASDDVVVSLLVRRGLDGALDTNFVVSCDAISSRYKSHSELLLSYQLFKPSVFVSYGMQPTRSTSIHTIKATASSQNFSLGVAQDPLVLLETLDLLVRDEAARLYHLKKLFPLNPAQSAAADPSASMPLKAKDENVKIVDRLSTFSVNVAVFLEHYTISLPLLRSLTYNISGVVARVAMAANFGREIIFDFDVKENSHDMQVTVNKASRSISLLQIPPTNGRITTNIGEQEQTVSVFSSLELVQLDAAAVYSLLSALNRPEISNAITDMQQQFRVIKRHLAEIFDHEQQLPVPPASASASASVPAKPPTTKPVIYSVHSTFAGLEVFGNVALKSDAAPFAHLSFCLNSIKLEATNRLEHGAPVLAYPELHVNMRQIAFEILKGTETLMSSCGSMAFAVLITASSKLCEDDAERRSFDIKSDGFDVTLSPDTVSTVVDVLGYMGDKIKDLDTSREMEYLRKLRQSKPRIAINDQEQPEEDEREEPDVIGSFLSTVVCTFEIRNIQINWLCASAVLPVPPPPLIPAASTKRSSSSSPSPASSSEGREDLVLLLERLEFGTRTNNSARLTIENLQLQMVPPTHDKRMRSPNSARLPEVIFNVAHFSTSKSRRFAFQAVGKSLDLRLTSEFVVPAAHLKNSIQLSIKNVQQVSRRWNPVASTVSSTSFAAASEDFTPSEKPSGLPREQTSFGGKRLESLLVDVDFAGAVVYISGKKANAAGHTFSAANPIFGGAAAADEAGSARSRRPAAGGKYGQFSADDLGSSTVLRSPGLAWKLEYRDSGQGEPSLYAEVKIDPSTNVIFPSVVPLVMDLTAGIKEVVSNSGKVAKLLQDRQGDRGGRVGQDVGDGDDAANPNSQAVVANKLKPEESLLLSAANPKAMLGRLNLNLGLRVCKQQFTLSCQPIARVAATTSFDDVYFTMSTIRTIEHGNFVAISGNISGLQASVQHVYSRESTGSFEVDSIVLSLVNSKHVSGVSGVSALLKVSPMKVAINVRQVQDFLLFREIWTPREIRKANTAPIVAPLVPDETVSSSSASSAQQQQVHLVQRYQQVAATAAFPWNASISIAALEINVDLGQALGKSVFAIEQFWVSSKKTSDWEQNLCLGFRRIGIDSTGRMSGFVALEDFKLRTSIEWPQRERALSITPLIQASMSFSQLRVKASFDYQAFLVADIQSLGFLMYNVRRSQRDRGDRLVAVFEGDAVQVFGTTTSAAQGVALYQAFLRLVQERKASFETSLRDIERFIKRRPSTAAANLSSAAAGLGGATKAAASVAAQAAAEMAGLSIRSGDGGEGGGTGGDLEVFAKSPISLDTDVVVTLRAVNLGVFPNAFTDHQVFKIEALNAQARFAASIENKRIHSRLELTLGQLRIGLAGVRHVPTATTAPHGPPKTVSELSVEDVVLSATGSRGGTILKVPRVEASMQTWQQPDSRQIDYIFKSALEGKVEVGWNYSRISYIRGMYANHTRTLEQTWGHELPLTAIRVTGVPEDDTATTATAAGSGSPRPPEGQATDVGGSGTDGKQSKITAEVNVPQSKYLYRALEPAIIETPQLRDMGEATPPLEWIGLHRDRLPNLTHQIVIVSLLELAGEVEDAYSRILGSS
ncbi:fermentation associated protein [Niveomyces insectorum RCEF 264]|uniref:Fermentation associated protein n=1 Tax=Niveomyces insectorum RCEF 264 TaxID=1081102 RepID=A0A167PGF4_9HYPO|nr:fermentation associated protein [Niveomyces insectorum RCEF 264]